MELTNFLKKWKSNETPSLFSWRIEENLEIKKLIEFFIDISDLKVEYSDLLRIKKSGLVFKFNLEYKDIIPIIDDLDKEEFTKIISEINICDTHSKNFKDYFFNFYNGSYKQNSQFISLISDLKKCNNCKFILKGQINVKKSQFIKIVKQEIPLPKILLWYSLKSFQSYLEQHNVIDLLNEIFTRYSPYFFLFLDGDVPWTIEDFFCFLKLDNSVLSRLSSLNYVFQEKVKELGRIKDQIDNYIEIQNEMNFPPQLFYSNSFYINGNSLWFNYGKHLFVFSVFKMLLSDVKIENKKILVTEKRVNVYFNNSETLVIDNIIVDIANCLPSVIEIYIRRLLVLSKNSLIELRNKFNKIFLQRIDRFEENFIELARNLGIRFESIEIPNFSLNPRIAALQINIEFNKEVFREFKTAGLFNNWNDEFKERHKQKIIQILNLIKQLNKKKKIHLLLFPELSLHQEFIPILEEFSKNTLITVLSGGVFEKLQMDQTTFWKNTCHIIVPVSANEPALIYKKEKLLPSKFEKGVMSEEKIKIGDLSYRLTYKRKSIIIAICSEFLKLEDTFPKEQLDESQMILVPRATPMNLMFDHQSLLLKDKFVIHASLSGTNIELMGRSGFWGDLNKDYGGIRGERLLDELFTIGEGLIIANFDLTHPEAAKMPTSPGSVSCNYEDPQMFEFITKDNKIVLKNLPVQRTWSNYFDKFLETVGKVIKDEIIKRNVIYTFNELKQLISDEIIQEKINLKTDLVPHFLFALIKEKKNFRIYEKHKKKFREKKEDNYSLL